jgi:tRNA modification GTPase
MKDTIIALASPPGESAIGLIRLSGPETEQMAVKLIRFNSGLAMKSRMQKTGKIYSSSGILIDEICAVFNKAPGSYTGEDTIEITSHGNPLIQNDILQAFLSSGARMARPGEFTERAFLNGKLDLTGAEAVNDIIKANTRYSRAAALNQLQGKLFKQIDEIHSSVMDLLAELEASIDHSDLDEKFIENDETKGLLRDLIDRTGLLLSTAPAGIMAARGVQASIIGATNTGKSSLMNLLLREDRVIVSDIPGTTRDVVHEKLNIMGVPVNIYDTAGLRDSKDPLERKGMEKTSRILEKSDLRIVVLDCSRPVSDEDSRILRAVSGLKNIFVLNKIDLETVTDLKLIKERFGIDAIRISAATGEGLDILEKAVHEFYFSYGYNPETDVMIANARQEDLLRKTHACLLKGLESFERGLSAEFTASDLQAARSHLEEITGKTSDESLLDRIFSKFCIGK